MQINSELLKKQAASQPLWCIRYTFGVQRLQQSSTLIPEYSLTVFPAPATSGDGLRVSQPPISDARSCKPGHEINSASNWEDRCRLLLCSHPMPEQFESPDFRESGPQRNLPFTISRAEQIQLQRKRAQGYAALWPLVLIWLQVQVRVRQGSA